MPTRCHRAQRLLAMALIMPVTAAAPVDTAAQSGLFSSGSVTLTAVFENGVEIHRDALVIRVTAVRDNIIRVLIGRNGTLPADSSSAVLSTVRNTGVRVQPIALRQDIGFATRTLDVAVDRTTLRLIIRDKSGRIISADVPSEALLFSDKRFSIRKVMPTHERYFGFDDTTGSLSRHSLTAVSWNTVAERPNATQDRPERAIPFVLVNSGDELNYGVLLDTKFPSRFEVKKATPHLYCFGADDGPIDYYTIYGPTPSAVLADYELLVGKRPTPPK